MIRALLELAAATVRLGAARARTFLSPCRRDEHDPHPRYGFCVRCGRYPEGTP